MRRFLSALLFLCATLVQAQETVLADRVVAVVDDDPILWSDVVGSIRLGLVSRQEGEDDQSLERRTLDTLIEMRLRSHEIDRFGVHDLPIDEVEQQYRQVRARFPDEQSFNAELTELGLTPEQVKEVLARQMMVMVFVEQRLGPRVFVSLDEIRDYYEEVLVPELTRQGEPIPELGEVREQIRAVLREERLNQEIDEWTQDLFFEADISDLLETEPRELPPVID